MFINQFLEKSRMQESVTFQAIYQEGVAMGRAEAVAEGKLEEIRKVLIRHATKRFGKPSSSNRSRLRSITDEQTLLKMVEQSLSASTWEELFACRPQLKIKTNRKSQKSKKRVRLTD